MRWKTQRDALYSSSCWPALPYLRRAVPPPPSPALSSIVTGGVVPGATILRRPVTRPRQNRPSVSGADGGFNIPSLNVGTYTVTVALQGFKTAVLKDVTVTAGAPANVKATLEVGGLDETVVVGRARR